MLTCWNYQINIHPISCITNQKHIQNSSILSPSIQNLIKIIEIITFQNTLQNVANKNKFENYHQKYMPKGTRIEGYDPQSVKLFSKCARDHAARNSAKKTQRPSSKNNKTALINFQQTKKNRKSLCTFDMSESRSQRQKKFKTTLTPAVGQYNPKIQSDKPKLTWDILKVYHQRGNSKRVAISHNYNTEITKNKMDEGHKNESIEINNSQVLTQFSVQLSPVKNIQNKGKKGGRQYDSLAKKVKTEKQANFESKVYKTIKSQVDMSRMVGRKQNQSSRYNNQQSTEIDIVRSTDLVKPTNNKKYSFKNQISRQRANQALCRPLVIAADYSYDYRTIKPKKTSFVCFAKSVGRKNTDKSATFDPPYSYTHYDYDNYVWNGHSHIFSNTKTHMLDFKKQTNRSTTVK